MKKLTLAIVGVLAWCSAALGQGISYYPQTLPANSLVGRISPVPGPTTAIPISRLAQFLTSETVVSSSNDPGYPAYTMQPTDLNIIFKSTISSPATVSLLPAANFAPGTRIAIQDASGTASAGNPISLVPSGTDKINGSNNPAQIASGPYGGTTIETDGISNWRVGAPNWLIPASTSVQGTGAAGLDGAQFFIYQAPAATSTPLTTTFRADRAATYTGGTPGTVFNSIEGHSSPGTGVANNEWAIVGIVDNFSTQSTAENVGIYGQGNKKVSGSSSTWGGTFQCQELAGTADPTTSCTGLEVDLNANGTDAHSQRQGMQLVITKAVGANPAPTVTNGILLSPAGGLSSNGVFVNGILEQGTYTNGLSQTGTYTDGIKLAGTYTIGVDLTGATVTTAIALATGQQISLNSAAMTIDGTFTTGATTPTFTATNKPGSTSSSGPGTWIKVIFSGTTYWVPAWIN